MWVGDRVVVPPISATFWLCSAPPPAPRGSYRGVTAQQGRRWWWWFGGVGGVCPLSWQLQGLGAGTSVPIQRALWQVETLFSSLSVLPAVEKARWFPKVPRALVLGPPPFQHHLETGAWRCKFSGSAQNLLSWKLWGQDQKSRVHQLSWRFWPALRCRDHRSGGGGP